MIRILLVFSLIFGTMRIAPANSYDIAPLFVNGIGEIVAFTNGLQPSTGTRKILTKEQMLTFLKTGLPIMDYSKWPALEFPKDGYVGQVCNGVFVDKSGTFYFWILRSPTILKLETPQGAAVLIQLPP